ncbi:MAG: hypothetical protein RLZZ273_583 [Bacteroidota bacterium]
MHPQSGGAEAHLHEIFSRLVRRGHTVHLVTCGFEGAPANAELDGMTVHRIGSRMTYNLHVRRWWKNTGKALDVDVVVDDINKIPLMTPLFIDRPIVGIVHHLFGKSIFAEASLPAALYVHLSERRIPHVYKHTQMAVVSDSTRAECAEIGLPSANLTIIHNGIDSAVFPMRVANKAPDPVISYFGRLKSYKSVEHLLRAFSTILVQHPTALLWIIGRGDDEQRLKAIVRSLGVEASVQFHGYVDDERKISLLSQSWIVVNPSMKEGWGITNLEANACGTPVVSADSPGLRDSVKNDVSGLLYPYGDIRILSETISSLLSDHERLDRLSHSSVLWAGQFSWDQSAQQMETLLQRCIGT